MKTKLYQHQKNNLLFHLQRNRSADWSDCGTGKTLIALAKFEHLYNIKKATCLITCPLSVMKTWADEIKKHTDFECMPLTGTLAEKVDKLNSHVPIFISTYDSIAGKEGKVDLFKALVKKHIDMIVLDEATHVKNWEAKRTRALSALCDASPYTLALSGTFLPQNLVDTITLYKIVDGGRSFGENLYSARNQFFANVGGAFPEWELKKEKEIEFQQRLWINAIRVKKEDCLDLPPKVWKHYYCEMTTKQKDIYNETLKDLKVSYIERVISLKGSNPFPFITNFIKLKEIASGFIYEQENIIKFPTQKPSVLSEILEDIGEDKAIIYCNFHQELYDVQKHLPYSVLLYGGQSKSERESSLLQFQTNPKIKHLIANVEVGGYGINLIEANHVIYYSLPYSLIDFLQSQDRIHRIGQQKTCIYHVLLTNDTLEPNIYRGLSQHIDTFQYLLFETDGLTKYIGDIE